MRWKDIRPTLERFPLFESSLLLAGKTTPAELTRQLSRWKASGKLSQLRKGVYVLADAQRSLHPFQISNRLVTPSYVSLQSALAYYQLIPEYVPVVTSMTTARPGNWDTSLGRYQYHYLQPARFEGYRWLNTGANRYAFVAWPEKALLDLVYLTPSGDRLDYLKSLRLQNLDQLSAERLERFAVTPKLKRAMRYILELANQEASEYVPL